ncbi:MAG: class I SAM-dependent methyltransferase [Adlercreutzia equolifaciens]
MLDLGCGTGALAEIVLDEIPGCALVGVDLSANMAERAAERLGGRAEVVVGDAERLPFRDNSFDAAYCNDSFHHYPDPALAAFQVWRRAAPGRHLRRRRRMAAGARARRHERVDAALRRGDAHLLRGRDAGDPRHVVRQRELAADRPHLLRGNRAKRLAPSCLRWKRMKAPALGISRPGRANPPRTTSGRSWRSALRMGDAATSTSRGTWASRGRASPRPS